MESYYLLPSTGTKPGHMLPVTSCRLRGVEMGWGVWEARGTVEGDVHLHPVPGRFSPVQPYGELRMDVALPGHFRSHW